MMTSTSTAVASGHTHACMPGTDLPWVQFTPVVTADLDRIDSWLANERIHRWLDMGGGRQTVSKLQLLGMLMSKRTHSRLFGMPGQEEVGLVCLHDIDNLMGTAEVWGARGVYNGGPSDVSTAAFLAMLATGFLDLGREVISSWVVAGNRLSLTMHHRLGLTQVGCARARHVMKGRRHDRILFDMTRQEFGERYPDVLSEKGICYRDFMAQTAVPQALECLP